MVQLLGDSRRAVGVWAGLMAVTLLSWWLGEEEGGARAAAVAVLMIAFVKVRFVGAHFMELRAAPLIARVILDAYVVVVCATLVVIYLVTG